MFNNRMLAVAAVLLLSVPALGVAAVVVDDATPEQLVEGHTVFTVIEVVRDTTTSQSRFAAAVAVLVRESSASSTSSRFPGVLWFNDQYLVNPASQSAQEGSFRYPCGGAVMAVNAGDPDPRVVIAHVGDSDSTSDALSSYNGLDPRGPGIDYGDNDNPSTSTPSDGPDGTPANDADDPNYAWFNVTTDDPSVSSDGVSNSATNHNAGAAPNDLYPFTAGPTGPGSARSAGSDYEESYLITDPNDHVWVIDKYRGYTRAGTAQTGGVYTFPVWVVNILGGPVFIPDDGFSSCGPYNDLIQRVVDYYAPEASEAASPATSTADSAVQPHWDDETARDASEDVNPRVTGDGDYAPVYTAGPVRDQPPAGYGAGAASDNGFCYNGNPAPVSGSCPEAPIRLYNALLYFHLEDLTFPGTATRDHSSPATSGDTNGCQAGTEWACPGGSDDREGNSHSFHPATHANGDAQDCVDGVQGPNPTNHGGSSVALTSDPTANNTNGNHYYDGGDCDYTHATFDVDVYFSPAGRPFPPIGRSYVVVDKEGSTAPYQDYHSAYGS